MNSMMLNPMFYSDGMAFVLVTSGIPLSHLLRFLLEKETFIEEALTGQEGFWAHPQAPFHILF